MRPSAELALPVECMLAHRRIELQRPGPFRGATGVHAVATAAMLAAMLETSTAAWCEGDPQVP